MLAPPRRERLSRIVGVAGLVLAALAVAAGLGGAIAGGWMLPVYLILAALGGAFLLFALIPRDPFGVFLLWLGLGPFLRAYGGLELGAGIPNVTFARVVIFALAFYLLARTVAQRRSLALETPDVCVILLCVYYLLALLVTATSIRQELLDFVARMGLAFVVYFLTRALVRRPGQLRQISRVLLLAGLGLSALGFYEHFTGRSMLTPWAIPQWSVAQSLPGLRSAAATFGNPAIYGCFLAMVLSFNLHFFSLTRSRRWRALYGVSFVLNALAIYWCYRRSSWIALAVALLIVLVGHRRLRGRLATALAALALLIGLNWSTVVQAPLWQERVMQMSSVQDRLDLYAVQWRLGARHLLFGLGVGAVRGPLVRGGASHDTFMTLLLDGGVVLVLLYLLPLLIVLIRSALRLPLLPREGLVSRGLVWSLWGALAAYLTSAFVLDLRFFAFLSCAFWMFAALLWQLPELQEQTTAGVRNLGIEE